jgi:hypothetical protein
MIIIMPQPSLSLHHPIVVFAYARLSLPMYVLINASGAVCLFDDDVVRVSSAFRYVCSLPPARFLILLEAHSEIRHFLFPIDHCHSFFTTRWMVWRVIQEVLLVSDVLHPSTLHPFLQSLTQSSRILHRDTKFDAVCHRRVFPWTIVLYM